MLTLQNVPFSRNDPWLAPGSSRLAGNNVWAYLDLAAPDGLQANVDLEVPSTAPGTFDYVYNPALAPDATPQQRAAAATQNFDIQGEVAYSGGLGFKRCGEQHHAAHRDASRDSKRPSSKTR